MASRAWAVAGVIAAALAAPAAPAAAQPSELPVTVVTLTGRAEIFKKGAAAWKPAELRDEMNEGDGLRTSPSVRATIRTGGGHAIRVAAISQVFILPPEGEGSDQPVRVRMDRGWLWIAVLHGVYSKAPVEVKFGETRVTVHVGGVGLRLGRDGAVLIRVYHGLASVFGAGTPPQWDRSLKGEQELLVGANGAPADIRRLGSEPVEEPWVLWNSEQDYAAYGGPPPKR